MNKIEREEFILQKLKLDTPTREIASSLGISVERVRQIARGLGVSLTQKKKESRDVKIKEILDKEKEIGLGVGLSKHSAVLLNENTEKKYKDRILENKVNKVFELYSQGKKPIEIKRELNYSLHTVYKYLHLKGIRVKLTPEEKLERDLKIKEDYSTGKFTYKELGEKYDLGAQMIAFIITDYKAPINPNKESRYSDRMKDYQRKEGESKYKKIV